ncbi:MAG: CdaR family protein [Desulfobacteraceae bacterium]
MNIIHKRYTLSFGFIFLLLLLHAGCNTEPVKTSLLIPVKFTSVPSGLIVTSRVTEEIQVRIRGKPSLIDQVEMMNLEYYVDLFTDLASDPAGSRVSIAPGTYTIPVIEKRIGLPRGVEIVEMTPSHIRLNLEPLAVKTLPVTVPYTGKPASGHIVLPAITDPIKVRVEGAESKINNLKILKTKPVDLDQSESGFRKKVPLDLDETFITPSTQVVTATVPVKKKKAVKSFSGLDVEIKNSAFASSLVPEKISITVKGPHDLVHKKGLEENFHIFIDLKGLDPGVYNRQAIIELPGGLLLTEASPEIFTVKIEKGSKNASGN